ncbi:MAG: CDP-glucose 4,6-dehydratase, partial [Actinomycetota bacterium]|nr:CDP-glucose 4,6-dehydratase [Actinomycetota bacterium]
MTGASAFWQGRTVLVTGHTGFKGSWLCFWLQHLGAEVAGYALAPPTSPSTFDLVHLDRTVVSLGGDICDFDALMRAVERARPEIVFHLAAQSLLPRSYFHPVDTYRTNVMGTVYLLEAIRRSGTTNVVVNVTSDKCYENQEWVWGYRENDPKGGKDPYSSSKACAELVSAAYQSSFFRTGHTSSSPVLATARGGNVIGGGDWAADRLVPDVMRAVLHDRTVIIRRPDAVRPWQHVLDCLSGYLLLA